MKKTISRTVRTLALCCGLACVGSTFANDETPTTGTDNLSNSWLVRLRLIDVIPNERSGTISAIGGKVTHISSDIVPELDINYFFTPHISTELILATSKHNVKATGTALGNVDLGSFRVLPPTLTALYHLTPGEVVNPYIGAGINYSHIYDVHSGPVASSISYTARG